MANIEELSLEINITDKSTVNLSELLKQLERLKSLADSMNTIQVQTANISSINETTKAVSKTAIELENAKKQYEELAKGMASGAIRGEDLRNAAFEAEKLSTQINKLNERLALEDANRGLNRAKSATAGLAKETDKLQKTTKQAATGFDRIVQAFKRIILYRVIRNLIAQIGRAFTEGMKNYVQYSETADKTLSNLVNTGNQLKNTLGITFINILQALEPLIISLADEVINIANGINALFAAMRGQDTFDKAKKSSDSYAESLKNVNNQLLSFDKFEVLTQQKSEDLFETGNVSEQLGNLSFDVETLKQTFEGIKELIISIGGLIGSVMQPLLDIVAAITPAISGIITSLTPAIKGITDFVAMIVTFLDNTGLLIPVLSALGIALMAIKFTKAKDDAYMFNVALDNQKLQAHLAKMELDTLKQSTDNKSDADIRAAQQAYNHEKALLNQMKTTRALHTALSALAAVMGATALGATIGDLIKNWGEMSTAQKISQISTIVLTAAMTALAIANVAAQSGLGAIVAVPLAAVTIAAGIASAVAAAQSAKITGLAMGGIPGATQGTMFVTNEFGKPELMYENYRGQTEISNQESLENSFERAINNTIPYIFGGLLQGNNGGDVSFRPDGSALAIAVMPYLVSELNRQGLKVVRA